MVHDPKALETIRRCWQCDCDGKSDRTLPVVGGPSRSVQGMAAHMEHVTGLRPVTCPWRVFWDPLVKEVLEIATLAEKGMGGSGLGNDPPGILLDGMHIYLRSLNATRHHDMERDRKNREK